MESNPPRSPRAAPAEPVPPDTRGLRGRPRLSLAVLLDHMNFFGGGYEVQLRDALDARCRSDGHNLYFLYGNALDGPSEGSVSDNLIFKLVRPGGFDGIIMVSTMLGAFAGIGRVAELAASYRPNPMCSIGAQLDGIPSIVLDNRSGMKALVTHLIRDHGCRRVAFLAGPPKNVDAEARFEAYRSALEEHGLAFDPALVACGYFHPSVGRVAMSEILDRAPDVDGVAAGNDNMAISAIDVLRQAGRQVPEDVAVTGFDDLVLARLGNPPLTTVAQPFETLADLALRAVVDQVEGRTPPACRVVESRFVRRLSCGCGYHSQAYRIDTPTPAPTDTPATGLPQRVEAMAPKLAEILRTNRDDGWSATRCLLAAIVAEAKGEEEAFVRAVGQLVQCAGEDAEGHRGLQSAITCLHDGVQGTADLRIERAFFRALGLVALSNTTTQVQRRLALDDNYLRLLTAGSDASAALDMSSLREALIHSLPAAGVRTAFLSCTARADADDAQGSLPAQLVPAVCLVDGVPVQPAATSFPAVRLIPPDLLPAGRRHTLLTFPLAIDARLLGIVAFDYADGAHAYTAFRNEITSVLRSIRLHQDLVEEMQRREHSVQERVAATKRMEALSVLAGGIAHDLNNSLGPLVALPDVILEEVTRLPLDEARLGALRGDIESIKTASLRAAQTIKDLLTLGRQGRTVKETLDLNRVVRTALADSSLPLAKGGNLHVTMTVDVATEPLVLRASEAQLARAVGNLVRNAVEAIGGQGEIVVKTARRELGEPLAGYETIPPGCYAVLSVSDDGSGIDAQALPHVFEPFFTRKRTAESSGSGLGLAIVHGVVKEHDGFVDLLTTHTGSTFSLYLPLARPQREESNPLVALPQQHARILIVDDEPMQLRTCRRVLERLGYRVETMESGLRAYELFNQAAPTGESPFDLVIMDMVLGEMLDGLQIFELIQRLFPAQKAIVASGHAPNERAALAVKKGLVWLAKPYSIEALSRAVERVLRGEDG